MSFKSVSMRIRWTSLRRPASKIDDRLTPLPASLRASRNVASSTDMETFVTPIVTASYHGRKMDVYRLKSVAYHDFPHLVFVG